MRVERGISQESLAVDADVDRTYISGIERQEFNPTIDILERLAIALSVDIRLLFDMPPANMKAPAAMKSGRRPNK